MSRTPLREALKVLASEGLLELSPNRGARVAGLTAEDVDELFPVMGALEALAGELAGPTALPRPNWPKSAPCITRWSCTTRAANGRNISPSIRTSTKKSSTPPITQPWAAPTATCPAASAARRYAANMAAARWAQAVAEHEEMLAALEARDGPRLAEILKRHLRNKCETVKQSLAAADVIYYPHGHGT